MSRNRLLEGIREVGRDPALLLTEIGWRWSFGAISILVAAVSTFLILDSVSVDPRRLQAMAALNPLQLAQNIVEVIASAGALLWRAAFAAGVLLTVIWVPISALGRYATLVRPALKPGASLQVCFVLSVIRAMLALASIAAWFIAGMFAAMLGSATARSGAPNFGLMSTVLFLTFLVILGVWSTSNWFLSLVPLRREPTWTQCLLSTLSFIRSRRDELLEISIVNGILRAGLLLVAFLLSVAVSSVITNARILVADLLAISLLYFLVADFLYMTRLVAFRRLREEPVSQLPSAVFSHADPRTAMAQAGTAVPPDSF
jgi:hypothetical protein